MDANPQIGLAGCRIVNPDGSPQESVSLRYPGQKHCRGELDGLPGRIACVLGAAMIARTGLVRNLGGFDEDFFLYGEEQDLALRIRQSGFEIGFIPDAVVVHHGGQSESPANPAATWEKKVRAENIFYRKHYRPETIRRIHREELLKAAWRRATLRLSLPFARDPERSGQNSSATKPSRGSRGGRPWGSAAQMGHEWNSRPLGSSSMRSGADPGIGDRIPLKRDLRRETS